MPQALVSCANGLCYCITPMCYLFIMSDFRTLPSNRLSSFYYIVRHIIVRTEPIDRQSSEIAHYEQVTH